MFDSRYLATIIQVDREVRGTPGIIVFILAFFKRDRWG